MVLREVKILTITSEHITFQSVHEQSLLKSHCLIWDCAYFGRKSKINQNMSQEIYPVNIVSREDMLDYEYEYEYDNLVFST